MKINEVIQYHRDRASVFPKTGRAADMNQIADWLQGLADSVSILSEVSAYLLSMPMQNNPGYDLRLKIDDFLTKHRNTVENDLKQG